MRVLITGGFGYLGGRIAQFLASRRDYNIVLGSRHKILSPDWLLSAQSTQIHWESLANLEEICDGVDAVVHAAGMNAQDCASNPVLALEFNAVATARLLEAAIKQKVKRFIYLSTAHVYGSALKGVVTEETNPLPVHPYATSHCAGEDVVRVAYQRGDIEGIVIRISNAYGAPACVGANCWMLLVNDLCRQAVTSGRMVLRSSGTQKHDFVPLLDVCGVVHHLLCLSAQNLNKALFNVGGGRSYSVWEVACLVQKLCIQGLGCHLNLTRMSHQNMETDNKLDYRIDLLRETGYQSSADCVGEIEKLIEFCKASFS